MTGSFIIEPLEPSHDRTAFRCGVDALDRYFRERAGQDARRRITACFVAREIAADRSAYSGASRTAFRGKSNRIPG